MDSGLKYDWVIYGNNISSLVLADKLGQKNKRVLLVQSGNKWGGIFSGIQFENNLFDIGMINFEFDLFGNPSGSLKDYNNDKKNDLSNYINFVKEYVCQFIDIHKLPTPQMIFKSNFFADIVISNEFEFLLKLDDTNKNKIKSELEHIIANENKLHARQKRDFPDLFEKNSLYDVSVANHGETFHNLVIEKICQKVLALSSKDFPAFTHRGCLAPLYYPETLLSYFTDNPQVLKPTVFSYPNADNFGEIVKKIYSSVLKRPTVTILENTEVKKINFAQQFEIQTAEKSFYGHKFGWCSDLVQLANLMKIQSKDFNEILTKRDLDLFFLLVKKSGVKKDFSVLIDVEEDSPFYRITNQSICSQVDSEYSKIILEANSKFFKDNLTDSEVEVVLAKHLEKYGIDHHSVKKIKYLRAKNALTVPQAGAVQKFIKYRDEILNLYKNLHVLGTGSGYWSTTFNDQVLQALVLAEE